VKRVGEEERLSASEDGARNCNDGGEDWALPPVGSSDADQYHTGWMPKSDVPLRNSGDDKYDCSCMKNCLCTAKECWCVEGDQSPVGKELFYNGIKIRKVTNKKGKCSCACGGVLS